jgi:hypothetical protein
MRLIINGRETRRDRERRDGPLDFGPTSFFNKFMSGINCHIVVDTARIHSYRLFSFFSVCFELSDILHH